MLGFGLRLELGLRLMLGLILVLGLGYRLGWGVVCELAHPYTNPNLTQL